MKLTAHMMVKNEDRWIWYAVKSVLPYVDEMFICDTGSTDRTWTILKSLSDPKIKLTQNHLFTPTEITSCRQKMLDHTKSDWVFFVDGDEIWPPNALSASLTQIQSASPDTLFLVNSFRNLVGDVYHYQESAAGHYHIAGYSGHVTIRFINLKALEKIKYVNSYPDEGLQTSTGLFLQDCPPQNCQFITPPYLHCTHLTRSSLFDPTLINRQGKYKYELGIPMEFDFPYPISFFQVPPIEVISPWSTRPRSYLVKALAQTPFKIIHRHL